MRPQKSATHTRAVAGVVGLVSFIIIIAITYKQHKHTLGLLSLSLALSGLRG